MGALFWRQAQGIVWHGKFQPLCRRKRNCGWQGHVLAEHRASYSISAGKIRCPTNPSGSNPWLVMRRFRQQWPGILKCTSKSPDAPGMKPSLFHTSGHQAAYWSAPGQKSFYSACSPSAIIDRRGSSCGRVTDRRPACAKASLAFSASPNTS